MHTVESGGSVIFDIDSHFEPGEDWLDPYPELSSRLPTLNPAITAIDGIAGNLLRDVPEADQPTVEELTPPGLLTLFAQEKEGEAERRAEFEGHNQFEVANAAARVEWLDSQGIDVQNVICLSGMAYRIALEDRDPPLLREAIRACNGWLADNCDAAAGRLLPVTTLDCSDLDWAIEELTRMRARNSRIFLIPGYPVNGIHHATPNGTGCGLPPRTSEWRRCCTWASSAVPSIPAGPTWAPTSTSCASSHRATYT